jgi:ATP-dependent Clp protease protease subunit
MILQKKKKNKDNSNESETDGSFSDSILVLQESQNKEESRIIGLFGDVAEETGAEVITNLLILSNRGEIPKNERRDKYAYPPIEFYLNTHGGSASDMFAIYDMMRQIRKKCEIHTIGMGKIMSAGVLLLAAGTKGKRKIGANARVMIHSVLGGSEGPLFNIENEFEEIKFVQEAYSRALTKETNLTSKSMKELLERHVNIYLSAAEAVKYGIADEVI